MWCGVDHLNCSRLVWGALCLGALYAQHDCSVQRSHVVTICYFIKTLDTHPLGIYSASIRSYRRDRPPGNTASVRTMAASDANMQPNPSFHCCGYKKHCLLGTEQHIPGCLSFRVLVSTVAWKCSKRSNTSTCIDK